MPQAFSQPSASQDKLYRMVDAYPSAQIAGIAVLSNADNSLRLEQIQALPPESFVELPPGQLRITDTSRNRSLWLKISLRAPEPVAKQQPSAISVLEIQKPYLDQLALYTPIGQPGEGWQVQRSGDSLAIQQWSLPGQFPRFSLPSISDLQNSPGGQMVVYLHVPHRIAASFDMRVLSAAGLVEDLQRDYVLLGLTFGFMLLAVVLSMALFAFHRDILFVWYAVYAFFSLFACLSHSGLAFQYLWPWGGEWPSSAATCFALIGFAAQLQFCKLMFMPSASKVWLTRLCEWLGGSAVFVALVLASVGREFWIHAILLSQAVIIVCAFLSCSLIAMASWRGNKFAMMSALTFLPLFVSVIFLMANALGIIGLPEFGYNAPLYAFALELGLLSICLLWFGHHRHGQIERSNALATTDPLTGFATAQAFKDRFQRDWSESSSQHQDVAVAYIEIQTPENSRRHLEQLLKRSVRVLRAATRASDVVARLDGKMLALLMHDVQMGDELNQRLARIVALGLMPESSEPGVEVLKFRIAATTRKRYAQLPELLDQDLRALIADSEGWGSKPIRYLEGGSSWVSGPKFASTEVLAQHWDQILGDEISNLSLDSITTVPSPRR
ncbi:7TM diverse intracellular signaling domain-containing protein [Variovorax sp. PCZ-1]|uniref:sensor domain-containing diguanylate cyclase n=1 Tax=Variovorax sp. PCZ-1 TaxID=2835533 RepID=UPI001BCF54B8|nr:7TM diverse intracellular signaling domain-containing protein [Variovorax sp. PCZ-1]MBS7808130.1 diguanylate cyclase [Variovorax sp. PCZ-1]